MESPSCLKAGCPSKDGTGANPGDCTGIPGVLSAMEINQVLKSGAGAKSTIDAEGAVMIATWGGNQWISHDNIDRLKTKVEYANKRCLGR
jgi:chitinase